MVVDDIPTAPTILGEWDDPIGLADAKRLDVAGGYAYVPSPTNDSLNVILISEADKPVRVGARIDNMRLNGAFDVKVVGKYAYVTCSSVLTILDISQSANILIVGTTPTIGTDLRDVFIIGKYALVIVEGDNKLSVIDIEDPTNPFEVNSMDLPRKPTRGYLADGFLYTAHLEGGIITTDVSDPANPFIFGESTDAAQLAACTDLFYTAGWLYVTTSDPGSLALLEFSQIQDGEVFSSLTGLGTPQTVEVYGDYAFLNDGRIIDISDRLNPVQVAQGASREALKMVGKFGVAVSDAVLTIFDNTGFDAATGNVGSLKAGCISVDADLTVSNNIIAHNKMNVGIGGIHCDGIMEAESITTRQLDVQGNVIGRATDPIFVGSLVDSVFEDSERLALSSTLTYIPSPTNNSITAVDVSDEINPIIVSTLKDDIDLVGAFAVVVRGMLAYVTTDSAIVELDISNPSNISINTVGTTPGTIMKSIVANAQRFYVCSQSDDILYSTKFVSSVFSVVGSVQLDRTINNMFQFENFIYTAPAGGGFHIVNIEDSDNPSLLTDFIDVTNLPVTNDVFVSGQFAYFSTDTGLSIYNISDKTTPVFVGKFTDNLNHESIFLSGSEAFLSNGIKVIDVGDKTNPQEVGISAVPSSESDIVVSGQTLCTVKDGETSVYNITGATLPAADIGTLFATNLDVTNNLVVGNDATFNLGITVGSAGIFTTGPITGASLAIDNIFIDGNTISSTDTDGDILIAPDGGGSIGIGTDTPDSQSSILDIQSTIKGVVFPRMTTVEKDAITTPIPSLILNDTDKNTLERYSGTEYRSFATQGSTTREAWTIEDFPEAVSNVITINSGLTILKNSISTADRFNFPASQNVILRADENLNMSLDYTGVDTLLTSTGLNLFINIITLNATGDNLQMFDVDGSNLQFVDSKFILTGTGTTLGTIENTREVLFSNARFEGYENGLTFEDNRVMVIADTIFRSNLMGTGATINIVGFLNAPIIFDTTGILTGENESGFFIDPQITNTITIVDCPVLGGQYYKIAPEGTFTGTTDNGETNAVLSVSDGTTNAVFNVASLTNVIDDDIIVHTGFSESSYNGTFEVFNVAGNAYEIRDILTAVPIAFVADDTGSGTTNLTAFLSTAHGLDGSEKVTVTSELYPEVGSSIRGTPLTNSFDLRVAFNGSDAGIWQVDVQPFTTASDLSVSNAITSVEAVAFDTRFVSTVALSGLQEDDIVTHTGFTESQYNGEFRITNILTNSYDVVGQISQFSVTDTGDSDSNLTRFDIISHGLTEGTGVQLKSTLYNEGGRIRQLLTNSIDVSVAFKGNDVGTININSLDQTDPRVTVSNSQGSPDSQTAGGWQVSGNTSATVIASLGTFVDLNFTDAPATALSFNERILLTDTVNGEIEYIGKTARTITIPLESFITTATAAIRRYMIKVVIDRNDGNGFLDTPDNIQPEFDVGSVGAKTSDGIGVFLEEGDKVKWQIAQVSGGLVNPTVTRGSMEIPNP